MSEIKGKRPVPPSDPTPGEPAPMQPVAAPPIQVAPVAAPAVQVAAIAAPPVPGPVEMPAIARRRSEAVSKEMLAVGRVALASFAESQAAMARGFEALALEMTGFARAEIAAASDSAIAMLGAKTLADAVEAQISFARRSVDMMIGGSARLTEIGVRLAGEVSRPVLSRIADPAKALSE